MWTDGHSSFLPDLAGDFSNDFWPPPAIVSGVLPWYDFDCFRVGGTGGSI